MWYLSVFVSVCNAYEWKSMTLVTITVESLFKPLVWCFQACIVSTCVLGALYEMFVNVCEYLKIVDTFSHVSCLDLCICFSTLHSPQFQVNSRSTQESRWSPVQVCNYSRSCKKRDLEACFSVFMSLYYVFAMCSTVPVCWDVLRYFSFHFIFLIFLACCI